MQKSIRHHARKARAKAGAYDLAMKAWNEIAAYMLFLLPVAGALLFGVIEKYIF